MLGINTKEKDLLTEFSLAQLIRKVSFDFVNSCIIV